MIRMGKSIHHNWVNIFQEMASMHTKMQLLQHTNKKSKYHFIRQNNLNEAALPKRLCIQKMARELQAVNPDQTDHLKARSVPVLFA